MSVWVRAPPPSGVDTRRVCPLPDARLSDICRSTWRETPGHQCGSGYHYLARLGRRAQTCANRERERSCRACLLVRQAARVPVLCLPALFRSLLSLRLPPSPPRERRSLLRLRVGVLFRVVHLFPNGDAGISIDRLKVACRPRRTRHRIARLVRRTLGRVSPAVPADRRQARPTWPRQPPLSARRRSSASPRAPPPWLVAALRGIARARWWRCMVEPPPRPND